MPTKILSDLVNSNYQALNPSTALPVPVGTVADVPTYQPPFGNAGLEADYNAMYLLAGSNITLVNTFMSSYNQFTNGLPGDINDFTAQFVNFLVTNGVVADTDAAKNAATSQMLNGFALSFETSIGLNSTAEKNSMLTVFPNIATFGLGNVADPDQMGALNSMWNAFAKQYHYQANGALGASTSPQSLGFFQELRNFSAPVATVLATTVLTVNTGTGSTVVAPTSSFKDVFAQYFPTVPVTSPTFTLNLAEFQRSMIAEHGFFSPSQQYAEWAAFVQTLALTTPPAAPTLPVTRVNILTEIFILLTNMITALQNVAASQASRLAIYTAWQKGYTDLLNQVPTFTGSSKDRLADKVLAVPSNPSGPELPNFTDGISLDDKKKLRQDEQGNFNAGVTQQITAFSNTVSQDAKSLQSNVNQSSDAYNNQSNVASTILQNLATITNAIFR